jgi:hypothetical protein
MRARTPCATVGRGQASPRRLQQAGVGTCPGFSLRQSISSTESVDNPVHKWFTEMSSWHLAIVTSDCPRKRHTSKYLIRLLVSNRT